MGWGSGSGHFGSVVEEVGGFTMGFGSSGCVKEVSQMVCVSTLAGEYLLSVKGRQSIAGWFLPWVSRSRLGKKESCCYIRGMCMERRCLYCGIRGLGHALLNTQLLTSFQARKNKNMISHGRV